MTTQNFFELLIYKTRANLKAEVSRLYLNYAWWALEPLFSMGVFYVVFGIFMNSQTPHFALFLLIGTTQWQWFASTVQHASNSIRAGIGVMQSVDIPKIFFPLEVVLQDSFKHLFVLLLMACFLLFYPIEVSLAWFALPVIIVLQFYFIIAVSILFSSIVPFFPDLRLIISTFLNIMFFVSGIFFDPSVFVLPEHRSLMFINPMAGILREYRKIILNGQFPDWVYCINVFMGTTVVLIIALGLISYYNRLYPRICQQ